MLPPLDLHHLHHRLAAQAVGHTIHHYPSVASTMPLAVTLAQDPDARAGTVVVADEQTQGRGRLGRSWHAPPRTSLLVSVTLKAPHPLLPPSHVTMLAANALVAAVTQTTPELSGQLALKWPNDLVLVGASAHMRKVAGVLAESSLTPAGEMAYAVLGIGVNVNQTPAELPRLAPPSLRAGSLRVARGRIVDRTQLLALLCEELSRGLHQSPAEIHAHWSAHLATLGQAVHVYTAEEGRTPTLTGQAVAVDSDGALIVEDDQGVRHTIHAGDVSVRPTAYG